MLSWANGRCMVWDFTCPDTLAASHLNYAVIGPGAVANHAESRKTVKYNALSPLYRFVPVAVETLGALGDRTSARHWPANCCCDWRTEVASVSDAATECDIATRQCCLRSWDCRIHPRTGRYILFVAVFCWSNIL